MNDNLLIAAKDQTGIVIGANSYQEIIQNVRIILNTVKGTLYLDRLFGLDPTLIDLPQNIAIAQYRAEIIEQIEKYEPRVNVTSVNFTTETTDAMDGILSPVVRIEIKEGTLL